MSGAPSSAGARAAAPFGRRAGEVTANRTLGAYRVLSVCDRDGPAPEAGQFYMLAAVRGWGAGEGERPFLGRAFSVLRARDQGPGQGRQLEFMLEDVGPGTARLCELRPGESIWLTGPLGVGFAVPADDRRPLLAGGGVGIAPLAIWQDRLESLGRAPTVLLGFRDGAHAPGAELMRGAQIATDDGSAGHHGRVTDLLAAELDAGPAHVFACGPPAMLENVRVLCGERDVPAQLALEAGMACGFGACFGCVVATHGGYLRLCVDGPVVDAAQLRSALAPGPEQLEAAG